MKIFIATLALFGNFFLCYSSILTPWEVLSAENAILNRKNTFISKEIPLNPDTGLTLWKYPYPDEKDLSLTPEINYEILADALTSINTYTPWNFVQTLPDIFIKQIPYCQGHLVKQESPINNTLYPYTREKEDILKFAYIDSLILSDALDLPDPNAPIQNTPSLTTKTIKKEWEAVYNPQEKAYYLENGIDKIFIDKLDENWIPNYNDPYTGKKVQSQDGRFLYVRFTHNIDIKGYYVDTIEKNTVSLDGFPLYVTALGHIVFYKINNTIKPIQFFYSGYNIDPDNPNVNSWGYGLIDPYYNSSSNFLNEARLERIFTTKDETFFVVQPSSKRCIMYHPYPLHNLLELKFDSISEKYYFTLLLDLNDTIPQDSKGNFIKYRINDTDLSLFAYIGEEQWNTESITKFTEDYVTHVWNEFDENYNRLFIIDSDWLVSNDGNYTIKCLPKNNPSFTCKISNLPDKHYTNSPITALCDVNKQGPKMFLIKDPKMPQEYKIVYVDGNEFITQTLSKEKTLVELQYKDKSKMQFIVNLSNSTYSTATFFDPNKKKFQPDIIIQTQN